MSEWIRERERDREKERKKENKENKEKMWMRGEKATGCSASFNFLNCKKNLPIP